jgi:hypothetical protein
LSKEKTVKLTAPKFLIKLSAPVVPWFAWGKVKVKDATEGVTSKIRASVIDPAGVDDGQYVS